MLLDAKEILETFSMIDEHHLDVRTITIGINLYDCASPSMEEMISKIVSKILKKAHNLVPACDSIARQYGIPIINKRISLTPISQVAASCQDCDDYTPIAIALDKVAEELGIDYLGGFSAQVHKGTTPSDLKLIESIPTALNSSQRVCSSISLASSKAGINMPMVYKMAQIILDTSFLKPEEEGLACGKLVVFCNQPEDNPFIAGAMHGQGEADTAIHVGVSGPGVVLHALRQKPNSSLEELATTIKNATFKITRMGRFAASKVAQKLNTELGIIDLSLAPTPAPGDSIAEVLEEIGLGACGGPGTTAALALLNDAVKRGGMMASSKVGGLSGAFIPVSEDARMAQCVAEGHLSLNKLEAMTCVCSVGLDMVPIPGDTTVATIAGIIADEMAIGMVNNKTTAARLIPVPYKKAGDWVDYGGLLGGGPILEVGQGSCSKMFERGGSLPAPLQSLKN